MSQVCLKHITDATCSEHVPKYFLKIDKIFVENFENNLAAVNFIFYEKCICCKNIVFVIFN